MQADCGRIDAHDSHWKCGGLTIVDEMLNDDPLSNFVKSTNKAMQDLAWMIAATQVGGEVIQELQRAVDKHGFDKTPMNPDMDRRDAYIIISEEHGEVARALTYDGVNRHKLEEELIQVAAMAVAMLVGIRGK